MRAKGGGSYGGPALRMALRALLSCPWPSREAGNQKGPGCASLSAPGPLPQQPQKLPAGESQQFTMLR